METILEMAAHGPRLNGEAESAVRGMIAQQVRRLAQKPRGPDGAARREMALHLVKKSLRTWWRPEISRSAASLVAQMEARIPESQALFDVAVEAGSVSVRPAVNRARRALHVVHDSRYAGHLANVFHMESAHRVSSFEHVLTSAERKGRWWPVEPRPATEEELLWFHTREYVDRVAATQGKALTALDTDTQTTESTWDVARLAAGGVFCLLDRIQAGRTRRGMAFVRPPGHHALAGRAMGFCIFNNVALGAHYARKRLGLSRVMIVDMDAHHGNGIQEAFYANGDVLYLSFHEFPAYPGTGNMNETGEGPGLGANLNVPLPKNSGGEDFIRVIHHLAAPVARQFRPDVILVACGFDLYSLDRLARFNGTPDAYAALGWQLAELAGELCQGRIAFVTEGGYSQQGIEECGGRLVDQLLAGECLVPGLVESALRSGPGRTPALKKAMKVFSAWWKL